jgi:DNA-binding MarR family transcriptional regulator
MTRAAKPPRFVFLLNRAQKALQRWIETRPQAWDGISAAQAGLLFFLTARDQATVGEIAAALDVAPAAVTNLSKRMEAAQLVARTSDASDGRITRLHLTAAGVQASAHAGAVLKDLNQRLTAGFSAAELATVERWLAHVHQLNGDSSDGSG